MRSTRIAAVVIIQKTDHRAMSRRIDRKKSIWEQSSKSQNISLWKKGRREEGVWEGGRKGAEKSLPPKPPFSAIVRQDFEDALPACPNCYFGKSWCGELITAAPGFGQSHAQRAKAASSGIRMV